MATAVIGTGNIGRQVARQLVAGGERIVLASTGDSAALLAAELGDFATSASVADAIASADAVVFATWFDATGQLLREHANALHGKVVVDASNNIAPGDDGNFVSRNPEGVSAGQQLAEITPADAHFVKAFGTLPAEALAENSGATPRKVLFYATDDDAAATAASRLITVAGWAPVRAGGLSAAGRIEVFGDLHPFGGLAGALLTEDEAQAKL